MIAQGQDILPAGNLVKVLLAFAHRLRGGGMTITPTQLSDCLRAMQVVGLESRPKLRMMMERIFVSDRKELQTFRELFELFWVIEPAAVQDDDHPKMTTTEGPAAARSVTSMHSENKDGTEREAIGAGLELAEAATDFSKLRIDDLERVQDQVLRMARKLGKRLSRRQRRVRRAYKLDIRRSVRRGLQHGGELIKPVFRIRRQGRTQLYALVDISGSMAVYGYFFLLFLHSLQKVWPSTYSFVFSTHLTPVSQNLAENDFGRAWNQVLASGANWSGGTNMGNSFMDFYRNHLRPSSASRAVVIVVSDGWDRGDPESFGASMRLISKHCRRLYWLNPLLCSTEYQPICQGMREALPHLNYFLPFYNLKTLKDFCRCLEGADDLTRWGGENFWTNNCAAANSGKEL